MSFSKNILICVFFTSLVSATPTCEECTMAFSNLVDTWWPVMASILYPSLIVPQDLCAMAGSCTEDNLKDWTCEDCLGGVVMAAGYFESEESIQMAIDLLAGDAFCGTPDATPDCAEQMEVWLPVAIPILAGTLRAQEVEICQEEVGV